MRSPPTLKKRRDFQKVSHDGKKWVTASFILQAIPEEGNAIDKGTNTFPKVGYTVSKKVGKAVVRNAVKRRLREIFRAASNQDLLKPYGYVVIARRGCDRASFENLSKDFFWALKHLHRLLQSDTNPA